MKTADERLRAAARDAAHIFPPGDDLPPLCLPDPNDGRRRAGGRVPGSATGRSRAWLTPLAAAAAVAVVIAGVAVLLQPAGKAGRPPSTRATALRQQPRRSFDALVVAAVAPATGPLYDTGMKLLWLIQARELRSTAGCMAAAGYHISGQAAPFDQAAFADNTQMPDLPRIARTHEFVPMGGQSWPSYPRAEQHAFNACSAKAEVPFQPLMRSYRKLMNSWWNIVFRIQGSAKVRAAIPALNACAARYGYPHDPYGSATGPIKTFADFMDWVAGFLDGAGSRGASTGTLRALARHWTSVFVTCARPIVEVWQQMQLAAQPGFLHREASQVRRLDQLAWQLLYHQPR